MTEIPTKTKFVSATDLKFITSGKRAEDRILNSIDSLLDQFHSLDSEWKVNLKKAGQISVLGRLYFATDKWLRIADEGSNPTINKRRRPAVFSLYKTIVNRIVEETGLTINVIPSWLERTFGKDMGAHGVEVDLEHDSAKYLSEEDKRKYKIIFRGGLAYQQKWWEKSEELTLADTEARNHNVNDVIAALFGGYAVSMSGDFYSGPHRSGNWGRRNGEFHSSYLSGNAVLCAGEIRIKDGVVTHINNNSGHYQPDDSNLARAVEVLAIEGVNIKNVLVRSFRYGERMAEIYLNTINQREEVHRTISNRERLGPSPRSMFEYRNIASQYHESGRRRKIELEFLKSHWIKAGGAPDSPGHGYPLRYKCGKCLGIRMYWSEMEGIIKNTVGFGKIESVVIPERPDLLLGVGPNHGVNWERSR